jgi:cytidylate kinase
MNIVITVSRQLGSRGSYIATEVAKQLGLRYIDREILQRAAEIAGYPDSEMIQQLERQEQVPGRFERIVDALNTLPYVPAIPSATLREGYFYDEHVAMLMIQEGLNRQDAQQRVLEEGRRAEASGAYADLVKKVILEYAQEGDVVIAGRGGQVILHDLPNALHIQVVAKKSLRVLWLMERLGIESKEAENQINKSDKTRARYMKHFHGVDWLDPQHYHLIINSGKSSINWANRLICEAARQVAREGQA